WRGHAGLGFRHDEQILPLRHATPPAEPARWPADPLGRCSLDADSLPPAAPRRPVDAAIATASRSVSTRTRIPGWRFTAPTRAAGATRAGERAEDRSTQPPPAFRDPGAALTVFVQQ